MAQRTISVLVDAASTAIGESASVIVNATLRAERDRAARGQALRTLLDGWDEVHGPVDEATGSWAAEAFDAAETRIVDGLA